MRIVPFVPLLASALGVLVLIATWLGVAWVTTMNGIQMRKVTAFAFILQGVAHTLLGRRTYASRLVSCILSVCVIGVMHGLLVAQGLAASGVLVGIDRHTYEAKFFEMPALGTILSFLMLSCAIVLYHLRAYLKVIVGLHAIVALMGFVAVVGHLLGNPKLFWFKSDFSSAMAPHTALMFTVLGVWGVVRVVSLHRQESIEFVEQ